MYLTGSLSVSQNSMPYTTYESQYGSASIGVDIFRYVRLSLTHSQEFTVSKGYKDPDKDEANATDAASNDDPGDDTELVTYASRSHVIGNSVDLQLIVYEGQVFVPYIMGGVILKTYKTVSQEEGKEDDVRELTMPGPNVGAGVGMRLNREFTLKLAYIASPGYAREPGDPEISTVWDRKVTLGITYQL